MVDDGKLSTNISALDEGPLGGIPEGSTIALVVDPKTMGNLVMIRLSNTGRRTHYTTINRDKKSVQYEIKHARERMDDDSKFGELEVYPDYLQNEDLKQNLEKYISRPEGDDTLLIDNLSLIHDKISTTDYEKLIRNTVKETRKRGGLTCLMVLADDISDLSLQEKDMLNTVDGIFKFESQYEQGERRDLLKIYKLRGVQKVDPREINVQIGKRLTLDASKKI